MTLPEQPLAPPLDGLGFGEVTAGRRLTACSASETAPRSHAGPSSAALSWRGAVATMPRFTGIPCPSCRPASVASRPEC